VRSCYIVTFFKRNCFEKGRHDRVKGSVGAPCLLQHVLYYSQQCSFNVPVAATPQPHPQSAGLHRTAPPTGAANHQLPFVPGLVHAGAQPHPQLAGAHRAAPPPRRCFTHAQQNCQ
jgi:hypothetical protein